MSNTKLKEIVHVEKYKDIKIGDIVMTNEWSIRKINEIIYDPNVDKINLMGWSQWWGKMSPLKKDRKEPSLTDFKRDYDNYIIKKNVEYCVCGVLYSQSGFINYETIKILEII